MIYFKNVVKSFGERTILKGVNFHIQAGKTTTIVGLSGSGKSTIIKHMVGLLKADSGQIIIDKDDINEPKALLRVRKKIGFLFQSGALFDSMNVANNIMFPLVEHTTISKPEMLKQAQKSLELVGMNPKEVLTLFPHELSGGMRKRVGLARTLISKPKIILYDEPTSGLDPISSDLITQMIRFLQEELKVTSVLISHDMKESFKSSDNMAMLYDGKIIEYGTIEEFKNSTNPYVIQFLKGSAKGPINFIT